MSRMVHNYERVERDILETINKINYCHECGVEHNADYIYLQYHK